MPAPGHRRHQKVGPRDLLTPQVKDRTEISVTTPPKSSALSPAGQGGKISDQSQEDPCNAKPPCGQLAQEHMCATQGSRDHNPGQESWSYLGQLTAGILMPFLCSLFIQ